MKGFNKNSLLVLILMMGFLTSMAQNIAPMEFTVNGKVKNGAKGEKVILFKSMANGTAIKLDSAQIAADGTFSIKGTENDRGSFFTLNIADRQKVVLLVEGGETMDLIADGFTKDSKGNSGKVMISGSKNMEFYAKIDELMSNFAGKVTVWNEEYAKAEEKRIAKKYRKYSSPMPLRMLNV